jgi:hypothetical protein
MGRHSSEQDTGENALQPVAAGFEPGTGYTDTPETRTGPLSGSGDPDDVALWDFRGVVEWEWYGDEETALRPVVTVELPPEDAK